MTNTPESIDAIFMDAEYVSDVQSELKGYDKPAKAEKTYKSYESDYKDYLVEHISSFKQEIEALAPVIRSPLLQVLKGTREYAALEVRLSDFYDSLERGGRGKPGKATNPGPKED